MRRKKKAIDDKSADGFTSMIDVVFLLLIFFVLQPFRSPEMRLPTELPKEPPPILSVFTPPPPAVRIEIVAAGVDGREAEFRLGRQRIQSRTMTSRELADAILQEANYQRDTPITLAPRGEVHFDFALRALDQCYLAEMKKINWDAPPDNIRQTRTQ